MTEYEIIGVLFAVYTMWGYLAYVFGLAIIEIIKEIMGV